MGGFPIYIGPAISLLFFLGVGYICANIFHIQGQAFTIFMMVMAAMGVSSAAFFYYFQNKIRAKKEAKNQAAAGGGAAQASGQGSSPEIDQLIKDADRKLAPSAGPPPGNLPLTFFIALH